MYVALDALLETFSLQHAGQHLDAKAHYLQELATYKLSLRAGMGGRARPKGHFRTKQTQEEAKKIRWTPHACRRPIGILHEQSSVQ